MSRPAVVLIVILNRLLTKRILVVSGLIRLVEVIIQQFFVLGEGPIFATCGECEVLGKEFIPAEEKSGH